MRISSYFCFPDYDGFANANQFRRDGPCTPYGTDCRGFSGRIQSRSVRNGFFCQKVRSYARSRDSKQIFSTNRFKAGFTVRVTTRGFRSKYPDLRIHSGNSRNRRANTTASETNRRSDKTDERYSESERESKIT